MKDNDNDQSVLLKVFKISLLNLRKLPQSRLKLFGATRELSRSHLYPCKEASSREVQRAGQELRLKLHHLLKETERS